MSNPKPEHRITAVEKRVTNFEGTIEELASDTAEELKVIHQDIKQLDERVQSGFLEIGALFDRNFETLDKLATKDDVNSHFDKVERDITELKTNITSVKSTQEQILSLLQQRSGG